MVPSGDRSEIAFFDLETTIPFRAGQKHEIIEFGSILVCPKKLVELRSYTQLVRPANLNHITDRSVNCNGIKREDVKSKPTFADIADDVYNILHGLKLSSFLLLCVVEFLLDTKVLFFLGL